MYKKDYFVEQMKKHAPQVIEPFLNQTDIESVYQKVPSISIDYALMEKADRIYMVRSDFMWSDVGNFKSLKDLGIKNSPGAVLIDSNAFVKTTNIPILREIFEDSGEYFDPYSLEDLAQKLLDVLSTTEQRETLLKNRDLNFLTRMEL
jgi:hypothetical protein